MKSNGQSVRLFIGIWWLMAIVLGASYSGTITSYMAIPGTKTTIDTTSKLLVAIDNDGFSCGAAVGTVQHLRMQDAVTSAIKRLKSSMYSDTKNVVISLNAGLTKALTEKYAFLYTKSSLEAELHRNWKDIFVISSDSIAVDKVGIAFQRNWPYQQDFNTILQRMVYGGLIDKWKRDVLLILNRNNRSISEPKRQDARALTLNNTQSGFYVLLIGYGISSGILVMEHIAVKMKKI
ncbi:ionotropic receptor 21a-like [Limulus polyphemus]|uniref:Ionotropic receptor 21a-like n=1 Tax=Limulus polyphemus TaxID=6850 RepID=A0ABM1S8Z8_LIMPO|nr:ionotropic receptor 21a-like [Limulus polyphemus]